MPPPTPELTEKARRIRLAVFDVDGVMTDGTLWLDDDGRQLKGFSVLDGLGLKLLADSGVQVAILTSRKSRTVELRAHELGITLLRQGVGDKLSGFVALLADLGLEPAEASHMGDDLPDLPVLTRCGLSVSVPNGNAIVRDHVDLLTTARGGHGAVREFCEWLMTAQGTLDDARAAYLR